MSIATTQDVRARAQQLLSTSPIYALREIQVEQDGDTICLRGVVSSFYHKQLAQELIRHALAGTEVTNSLRVR
jgi:BON domain